MFGFRKAKDLGILLQYNLKKVAPVKCESCMHEHEDCVKVSFADGDCVCLEKK